MDLFDIPIARATDSESSHLAADEITASGAREAQCQRVLAAVKLWPGKTSAELAWLEGFDRYTAARRLPELERRGLIRKGPARICDVGKRKAVIWLLVDQGPHNG